MASFKTSLIASGYTGETEQFYAIVAELFRTNCPDFKTGEHLTRYPRQALRFCEIARAHFNLPHLADNIVLGALENRRKQIRRLARIA